LFYQVENLPLGRFSSFYAILFSIVVSSLNVPLYIYRSSADDFRTKSVRPGFRLWA